MAALAGQQWPCAAESAAVIGGARLVLAIAIVIVAPPAWTLRKVVLDQRVNHCERIEDHWIVRIAQTEPDEAEKFSADNVACGVLASAVRDAKHDRVRLCAGVRVRGIGGPGVEAKPRPVRRAPPPAPLRPVPRVR